MGARQGRSGIAAQELPYETSGEPCRTIDLTPLHWLAPAFALLVIGIGIAAAQQPTRDAKR